MDSFSDSFSAQHHIESNDLVLFVTTTCPFCKMAIEALRQAGYRPTVIVVTETIREELYTMTGKTSVPSAWIKGTYIGGCNDGPESWMGVLPCIESGKLKEMLDADAKL